MPIAPVTVMTSTWRVIDPVTKRGLCGRVVFLSKRETSSGGSSDLADWTTGPQRSHEVNHEPPVFRKSMMESDHAYEL